ncbi:hypothetical protein IMZ48_08000 [Candidatus Bathyarchaeota archaeon]|nr:hypothetical protein [Candidatus Bathyarchaeota archaeon]
MEKVNWRTPHAALVGVISDRVAHQVVEAAGFAEGDEGCIGILICLKAPSQSVQVFPKNANSGEEWGFVVRWNANYVQTVLVIIKDAHLHMKRLLPYLLGLGQSR